MVLFTCNIIRNRIARVQYSSSYSLFSFSPMTIKEYGGCVFNYTDAQSYSWLATVLPVNAFFSAIFSYVVYKQYKTFGLDAWRRLAGDGIQTMCLVILCNIVCGVLLICRAFGEFSDLFFIIDCNWLACQNKRYVQKLQHNTSGYEGNYNNLSWSYSWC
ncbi:hypothetical protein BDF19DRAFT_324654 [Syncephalis fuscata]|nr:hypothetical protein BDF19DRAFT_324654 [Syncephalis fuscata]